MLSCTKHMRPMSAETEGILKRLAALDFGVLNETDVREAFLAPLIGTLGYVRGSDYTVLTEQQFRLNPLFLSVGSKRIKLDYRFTTYRAGFWLLEAKEGTAPGPSEPPPITSEMIGQAHFYAHHPEVDCPVFGVSNGWFTNLYDRDSQNPLDPILSIAQQDLITHYSELYELIGFDQITFGLKRRLLKRIEQVLSADVDLYRSEEFVREVAKAAASARPKVLENSRKARAENRRALLEFIDDVRTWDAIDTLLQTSLTVGDSATVSNRLAERVAQHPGSNQFLFFHKLMIKEPRPVTTHYYFNSLHLLGYLASRPELANVSYTGGPALTPISEIYAEYVEVLVFHLAARPELRLIWALEALSMRLCKRLLVSADLTRTAIRGHVELERFLNSEERNAFLCPSPAGTLLQMVEQTTLAAIGRFFVEHYSESRRAFDFVAALDEYRALERVVVSHEAATDDAYLKLKNSLGPMWSELTFIDGQNRSFDRLGHCVCEAIGFFPSLLPALSERSWTRIEFLASLGNSFARTLLQQTGRPVPAPHANAASELKRIFDPASPELAAARSHCGF